jgi:glycosyl transferase family 2
MPNATTSESLNDASRILSSGSPKRSKSHKGAASSWLRCRIAEHGPMDDMHRPMQGTPSGNDHLNVKLSVVLPLFNAQAKVRSLHFELIEVLPELSPQFEIVLVDDGSTDATAEVLKELVIGYPQVRLARHAMRKGTIAAMHTGLQCAAGHYVLFCDDGCSASVPDIQRLWRIAPGCDAVIGRVGSVPPLGWFSMLPRSRTAQRDDGAMMLVRRSVALEWSQGTANETLTQWGGRKKLAMQRVEVRAARPYGSPPGVSVAGISRKALSGSVRVDPQLTADSDLSGRNGPNFMSRVKTFAAGE